MGREMGIFFAKSTWKKKNRWKFSIPGVVDSDNLSTSMLPPLKAGRPSVSFKEQTVEHLIETVYLPGKADWSPLEVTLYDLRCNQNPVFDWLTRLYDPAAGVYGFLVADDGTGFKIPKASLTLLSGCGEVLEEWVYEGVWAQKMEWGELDMGSSEVVTVDLSLRYDRAYAVPQQPTPQPAQEEPPQPPVSRFGQPITDLFLGMSR